MGRCLTYLSIDVNGDFARFWRCAALAAALTIILPSSHAQDCEQCGAASAFSVSNPDPEWTIRKQVNEVNVSFVAGRRGRFSGDLRLEDITILDDNKRPAAILGFRTEPELPLRVGILIDTSSSVTSRLRSEQVAASAFLRLALNRDSDLAFILGFNDHVKLVQDFSSDPDLLSQTVGSLNSGGGTAVYDALGWACQKLRARSEQGMVARVLVVLSDGQNNAGTLNLNAAVDAAEQGEVTIYAISTKYPSGQAYSRDLAGQEGNSNLRKLAEQTGGRLLFISRPKNLSEAFVAINQELRNRYAVSYKPADFTPDGHYRRIKIDARKAGEKLEVRARKGYRATLALLPDSIADRSLRASPR